MTQAEGTDDLVNSAMLQNDLEQLRTRSVGCGSTTRKERKRSEHTSPLNAISLIVCKTQAVNTK